MDSTKKLISFDEAVKISEQEKFIVSRRDNGLLLSDYQIMVLNRNGINYKNFINMKELLFEIENYLDDYFDEELDMIGSYLSEFIYYNNTNK